MTFLPLIIATRLCRALCSPVTVLWGISVSERQETMVREYASMDEHVRDALKLMHEGWLIAKVVRQRPSRFRRISSLPGFTRLSSGEPEVVVTYTRLAVESIEAHADADELGDGA